MLSPKFNPFLNTYTCTELLLAPPACIPSNMPFLWKNRSMCKASSLDAVSHVLRYTRPVSSFCLMCSFFLRDGLLVTPTYQRWYMSPSTGSNSPRLEIQSSISRLIRSLSAWFSSVVRFFSDISVRERSKTSHKCTNTNYSSFIGIRAISFIEKEVFPEEYRNSIFIAEHGSWNRTVPDGYRITRVQLEGNKAIKYEVFAEGWLNGAEKLGRPVDILEMLDGSLLVSDDHANCIYRISYREDH